MQRAIILVPGLRGSGAAHWQSLWQASHPQYVRVLQRDWVVPRLDDWAEAIDAAIGASAAPAIVVAHGYGCLASIHRFYRHHGGVSAAMLVAPRDPDDFGLSLGSLKELEIPSVLVASRNDPDLPFARAKSMAARLGSRFVDAGEAGHIDAISGFGPWPQGERLLAKLIGNAEAREREVRVALALGA